MHDPTRTFWPVIGVLALVGGLVLIEPNLGTALVLAAIVFVMLWVAGTQTGRLGLVGAVAAFGASAMVLTTPFRRARFFAFLDPWADPGNTGYQNLQALVALGSGGLFGVGLGASRAKWDYLPFAQTDFIFAIIGEELGLVGAVFVVALFVILGTFGVRTALRRPRPVQHAGLRGHHVLVPGAGVPQHRHGDRPAADHRRAPAVHLLRWLVAARDHVCRRVPPQRGPPPEDPAPSLVTWALVAGGGTAGHLLPGLAVAEALVARGHERSSIHFVGSDRGVEAELVPAAGFGLDELPGRGHRSAG